MLNKYNAIIFVDINIFLYIIKIFIGQMTLGITLIHNKMTDSIYLSAYDWTLCRQPKGGTQEKECIRCQH
jgi:hypothetical protein